MPKEKLKVPPEILALKEPCLLCGKEIPLPAIIPQITLFTDNGERVALLGQYCKGCTSKAVDQASYMQEAQGTGRWELFDIALKAPMIQGCYGRKPTPEELARPSLILDEERSG